jgi:hypothetical protein
MGAVRCRSRLVLGCDCALKYGKMGSGNVKAIAIFPLKMGWVSTTWAHVTNINTQSRVPQGRVCQSKAQQRAAGCCCCCFLLLPYPIPIGDCYRSDYIADVMICSQLLLLVVVVVLT